MDLGVAKYKTEKPSKSPPPPPPRRSFPSAHGLTTNRTGEVVLTNKNQKVRRPASGYPEPEPGVELQDVLINVVIELPV